MINALGLLEVDGMVAAIDAADAMLKAANVRLLSHEVLDPGRLTLVVKAIWRRVVRRWTQVVLPRCVPGVSSAARRSVGQTMTPSGWLLALTASRSNP